jgi:hypothetical protein
MEARADIENLNSDYLMVSPRRPPREPGFPAAPTPYLAPMAKLLVGSEASLLLLSNASHANPKAVRRDVISPPPPSLSRFLERREASEINQASYFFGGKYFF